MKAALRILAVLLFLAFLCSCPPPGAASTSLAKGKTVSGSLSSADLYDANGFYYDAYYLGGPGTYTLSVTADGGQDMYLEVVSTVGDDQLWTCVINSSSAPKTFELKEWANLNVAMNSGDLQPQIAAGRTINYTLTVK